MPQPGAPGAGESRRASDEEKQVFQEFLANVVNVIYEPQTAESIGGMLRTAAQTQGTGEEAGAASAVTAIEPLAQVVAGVVGRVAYSGIEAGMPIEPEMAAVATAEIAEELGQNLAQSVGVPPLGEEQVHALYLRSMELLADQREQRGQGQSAGGAPPRPEIPPGV